MTDSTHDMVSGLHEETDSASGSEDEQDDRRENGKLVAPSKQIGKNNLLTNYLFLAGKHHIVFNSASFAEVVMLVFNTILWFLIITDMFLNDDLFSVKKWYIVFATVVAAYAAISLGYAFSICLSTRKHQASRALAVRAAMRSIVPLLSTIFVMAMAIQIKNFSGIAATEVATKFGDLGIQGLSSHTLIYIKWYAAMSIAIVMWAVYLIVFVATTNRMLHLIPRPTDKIE